MGNASVSRWNNLTDDIVDVHFHQHQVVQYGFYTLIGLVMFACDTLIVLTIFLTRKLRRRNELVLIAIQSLSGWFFGLADFTAGVRRLHLVLTADFSLVSAWDCMTTIHTSFFILGSQLSPLMNLVVSVDRLIAVTSMRTYLLLGRSYIVTVTTIPVMLVLVSYCTALTLSAQMTSERVYPSICVLSWSFPRGYSLFSWAAQAAISFASVMVYGMVMLIFKLAPMSATPQIQEKQQRRQNRMTKTVALLTVCTFCMLTVPVSINTLLNFSSATPTLFSLVAPYMWLLISSHYLLANFIFLAKQADVRNGAFRLIRGHFRRNSTFATVSSRIRGLDRRNAERHPLVRRKAIIEEHGCHSHECHMSLLTIGSDV